VGRPQLPLADGGEHAVDAATFLLSAFTLAQVRPLANAPRAAEGGVLRSVDAGLAMVWRDTALRTCCTGAWWPS
jgi:hypothetical protein